MLVLTVIRASAQEAKLLLWRDKQETSCLQGFILFPRGRGGKIELKGGKLCLVLGGDSVASDCNP